MHKYYKTRSRIPVRVRDVANVSKQRDTMPTGKMRIILMRVQTWDDYPEQGGSFTVSRFAHRY